MTVDLAERGVTTPTGGTWRPTTLRRPLASARISGRRKHTPKASLSSGTRPLCGQIVATAVWPGIVTHDQSDRLRALPCAPGRRTHEDTGRTYLLSGPRAPALGGRRDAGDPRPWRSLGAVLDDRTALNQQTGPPWAHKAQSQLPDVRRPLGGCCVLP